MSPIIAANVGLRAVMESGIVAAFAYWGYRRGNGGQRRAVFAVAAPMCAFGVWGAVDFRQLGRFAEPARFAEELAISGLAATALWTLGHHALGISLGAVSAMHHAVVYTTASRLLKVKPAVAEWDTPTSALW
jgi:Protein of unknown function (DUF2568)